MSDPTIYVIVVALAALLWLGIGFFTGAYTKYLTFMGGQAKVVEARQIEELFATKFKEFNYAAILADRTGIGNGPFKVTYPTLRVGEIVLEITGFRVEGEDILALPNGTKIQFYVVSDSEGRRNRF